jgi:hypothetical protein
VEKKGGSENKEVVGAFNRQTPIAQIVGAGLMEDGYAATTTVTRWGEDTAELNFHISCELGA